MRFMNHARVRDGATIKREGEEGAIMERDPEWRTTTKKVVSEQHIRVIGTSCKID